MKNFYYIFGALIFVAHVYCQQSDEMKKVIEECRTELGVTRENLRNAKFDDSIRKCFLACKFKKLEKLVDGKLVPEKIIESYTSRHRNASDKTKDEINECVNTANKETDECEVTFGFIKCMSDKIGSHHRNKPQATVENNQ